MVVSLIHLLQGFFFFDLSFISSFIVRDCAPFVREVKDFLLLFPCFLFFFFLSLFGGDKQHAGLHNPSLPRGAV